MTDFKLLSLAAILSIAIVTPVFAQQAVDEPGLQAFYQSLGVGSHDSSRHGVGAWFVCERAGETHFSEALRTGPRQQVGAQSANIDLDPTLQLD
jgi:hypothetical protein